MEYPKPIRVISDLHLAHPACRIISVEQLRPVFEGAGTVIFNGDTAELRSRELNSEGESFLTEINEMLEGMGILPVFLRGNHDPNISEQEYIELESGSVVVIHGDCLYENISPWNPMVWKLEKAFEEERARYDPVELQCSLAVKLDCHQRCRLMTSGDEERSLSSRFKKMRAAVRLVIPVRRPIEILRCWLGLGKRIERFHGKYFPEKKWVIVGHTHRPGIWQLKNGLTGVNTGGFLSIGKAFIVEIDEKLIRVQKVVENGGEIRLGRTILERSIS